MRVRSKKSSSSVKASKHAKRPETSTTQHKPAKRSRNRVQARQRERILQKHIAGKSVVEMSREENRNRETVARIVHSDEMRDHVIRMRESLYGILGSCFATVQDVVEEEQDSQLAYKILTDTGAVPPLADRMRLLAPSEPANEEAASTKSCNHYGRRQFNFS